MFPNAKLRHLPRYSSDHNPIVLGFHLSTNRSNKTGKEFRFENTWLSKKTLGPLIQQTWQKKTNNINKASNGQNIITNKLKSVTEAILCWKQKITQVSFKNTIEKLHQQLNIIQTKQPTVRIRGIDYPTP